MKQQLPQTQEGWQTYLEESVEAERMLTLEELSRLLESFGTIEVGSYEGTNAHHLYPGLPPCPVFFNPHGLGEDILELLGMDLGLAYRHCNHNREERLIVAGVPGTGAILARGFYKMVEGEETVLLTMRTVPPSGYELERRFEDPRPAAFLDPVTATGQTAEAAIRGSCFAVRDFVSLVDRGEGARQLLQAHEPPVQLVTAIRLRTICRILEARDSKFAGTELALARYRRAVLAAQQEVLARAGI